jgi:hypothetical protein
MVIQTGMRTDIPAFYSEWFCNRLKAGYVLVRNPYNPHAVTRYRLTPDVVDLIAFCTKNPSPMLSHMHLLQSYGQYWFVTITPYGKEIEPNVPPKEQVMEMFQQLSSIVGVDAIGWRYDPIFINEAYPLERHLQDFAQMAAQLSGYTKTCVISFIDLYEKVKRNFPGCRAVTQYERIVIGKTFARIGRQYGMTVKACAEGEDLQPYGVDCRGCMTIETYETALHMPLQPPRIQSARKECACYLSNDIGAYDTCAHLCRYCYANANRAAVLRNQKRHNPQSPFLIGEHLPEDVIRDAKQKSWITGQMRF